MVNNHGDRKSNKDQVDLVVNGLELPKNQPLTKWDDPPSRNGLIDKWLSGVKGHPYNKYCKWSFN